MSYHKITILSICIFTACSGNHGSDSSKNIADANSTGNDARFSCIVDGQLVSGGPIDQMQLYNIAKIDQVDEGKELLFYLNDAKNPDSIQNFVHALRFSIPCKIGPVNFGHDENGWGIEVDIQTARDHQATYFSDSFTANVTRISSTNAAGTFSGKFELREGVYSTGFKKEIEVTDGKFDIPMKK